MTPKKIKIALTALIPLMLALFLFLFNHHSVRENSQQEKVKISKASSKKSQTSQAQTQSQSQAEQSNPNVILPIPQELVGTYKGSSPQASEITFTVSSNGQLRAQANFEPASDINDVTATVSGVRKVGADTYIWEFVSGSSAALLPGVTGIGGLGKMQPGFILKGGQLTPIMFTGPVDGEIDYSHPNPYPVSLNKQ
ncbi:TPA: hypothetical protein ACPQXP_001352 [Streptococcus mutans]